MVDCGESGSRRVDGDAVCGLWHSKSGSLYILRKFQHCCSNVPACMRSMCVVRMVCHCADTDENEFTVNNFSSHHSPKIHGRLLISRHSRSSIVYLEMRQNENFSLPALSFTSSDRELGCIRPWYRHGFCKASESRIVMNNWIKSRRWLVVCVRLNS